MIVVDTGPLVALFDQRDRNHTLSRERFLAIRERMVTTLPVLTEAFHLLPAASPAACQLRLFVERGGIAIHFSSYEEVARAMQLMIAYLDHPMDFADASVIATAEALQTRRVFTNDRNDFETYRIKRGHRTYPIEII
ncbi:MAG: PIN domain-containing protein [Alphaproteobacteria bacterium]